MASQTLTDAKIYVAQYDWSGDMNSVALEYAAEMQDATTFGQTTRINKGGLKTARLSTEGYWSAGSGEIDPAIFAEIGVADRPVSVTPGSGAAGEAAYLFRTIRGSYSPGAQIGEMLRFRTEAMAAGGHGLVRGTVLFNGTAGSTSAGTKYQLGAVGATQRLYAALHVLDVSGTSPTLDVAIESDADASAGSETGRISFTQATGVTSEWASVAGAITDTYWRISYTIGGTDPSFTFVLTAGIL